jgi:hypothetical protein
VDLQQGSPTCVAGGDSAKVSPSVAKSLGVARKPIFAEYGSVSLYPSAVGWMTSLEAIFTAVWRPLFRNVNVAQLVHATTFHINANYSPILANIQAWRTKM